MTHKSDNEAHRQEDAEREGARRSHAQRASDALALAQRQRELLQQHLRAERRGAAAAGRGARQRQHAPRAALTPSCRLLASSVRRSRSRCSPGRQLIKRNGAGAAVAATSATVPSRAQAATRRHAPGALRCGRLGAQARQACATWRTMTATRGCGLTRRRRRRQRSWETRRRRFTPSTGAAPAPSRARCAQQQRSSAPGFADACR